MRVPLMIPSPVFGRSRFANYLNEQRLIGRAVEIGTHRAEFAVEFLRRWHGDRLICIDPWTHYDPHDPASLGDREADYQHALSQLRQFPHRVDVMRKTSAEAVGLFCDGELDFVYVDGCHQIDSLHFDLWSWWPKVRKGGILAGHDYLCCEPDGGWGTNVQPAVAEFAFARDLPIWVVVEGGGMPWSFYLRKP